MKYSSIVVFVIVLFLAGCGRQQNSLVSEQLPSSAPMSDVKPEEIRNLLNGGNLTDLQRSEQVKSLTGSRVQWYLVILNVNVDGSIEGLASLSDAIDSTGNFPNSVEAMLHDIPTNMSVNFSPLTILEIDATVRFEANQQVPGRFILHLDNNQLITVNPTPRPIPAPAQTLAANTQGKVLVWERFDVDIEVMRDGTFEVAEHQQIRFTSGRFTSGYRDIPINNLDYIDGWAMKDDAGNVYRLSNSGGTDPYTFTVDQQSGQYIIHWYFPSIANATATYTLSYRVHGGLRFYEGGDQVWWKAIYANRSFPVLAGRVRVVVPNGATIQEWAAYINAADARDRVTATLLEGNQAVIFELPNRLDAGEELEVRVAFAPNVIDASQP